jgi:hypothetical protein
VIPYEINAPFWSDGAHKERFFALPDEGKITFHDNKPWEFEDGAVTVKSFSLDMEEGKPASRKRIETRMVVKQNDRWIGYTYIWNDEQTEAMLFSADETTDVGSDGGTPVSDDYGYTDSAFTGTVRWVQIDLGADAEDADHLITPEERLSLAMARQ